MAHRVAPHLTTAASIIENAACSSTPVQHTSKLGFTTHRRCKLQRHSALHSRAQAAPPEAPVPPTPARSMPDRYSVFGLSTAAYEEPPGRKTEYREQPFDRIALWYLCYKLAEEVGEPLPWPVTYDTFSALADKISEGRSPDEQRALVLGLLLKVVPQGIPKFFREALFPFLLRVGFPLYNAMAWGTGPATGWLVGPNEQEQVFIDGVEYYSKVKVKRCRYLESSGCKSQCLNICKMPTQAFFTNECGLPLTMNPDFETMSCELIFGQPPPAAADDKAFRTPCFSTCTKTSELERDRSQGGAPACSNPRAGAEAAVGRSV